MKRILIIVGLCIFFINCENKTKPSMGSEFEDDEYYRIIERRDKTEAIEQPEFIIKEVLGKPFGTIIKLKVEIVDGDLLDTKSDEGCYRFKVFSVDDNKLNKPIIMEFTDETGKFPTGKYEREKYLEEINNGKISKNELNKNIWNMYVGSEYEIVAYETGEFSGLPYGGNYEFASIPCGKAFHFKNYLVVLDDLTGRK